MSLTHFPHGLSSFGVPVLNGGVPFGPSSKVFFVSGDVGSDSNLGTSADKPFATVSKAHSQMTANSNDVCYVMANGANSGQVGETATIAWSKDGTHLIGVAAPGLVAQRAKISPEGASVTDVTPVITVSADGCLFSGLHFFQNWATNAENICVNVTGYRNVFIDCHIAGGGHATGAGHASMRSLVVDSPGTEGENYFKGCTIGLDTIHRGGAASAEIEFKSATNRNIFDDCIILARTTGNAHRLVTIGSAGISRWVIFRNCTFWEDTTGGGTSMTEMMDIPANCGGLVLCQNCHVVGATFESTKHGQLRKSQETDMLAVANTV